MAEIVLGIGTSHSPTLSLTPDLLPVYAQRDRTNPMLSAPPDGKVRTYEELLEIADPSISELVNENLFREHHEIIQRDIAELARTLEEARPDTVIIVGDDQEELFFDDNMPSLSIYWGESIRLIPRGANAPDPAIRASSWGYGDVEMDVPVDAKLGLHLIESLIDADFDVGHCRYVKEESGGHVGASGYLPNFDRTTEPRRQGMPHAYAFVVKRLMNNNPTPIVPIIQNTFYPPNIVTPRRCYNMGQAVKAAVEAWDSDKRVAIVGSGGLSHFVVDEEIDRMALDGMKNKDTDALRSLPRNRLWGGNSETMNWVAAAGAVDHLDFELLDYVPVYRTPAGTGGGWGFARWA